MAVERMESFEEGTLPKRLVMQRKQRKNVREYLVIMRIFF